MDDHEARMKAAMERTRRRVEAGRLRAASPKKPSPWLKRVLDDYDARLKGLHERLYGNYPSQEKGEKGAAPSPRDLHALSRLLALLRHGVVETGLQNLRIIAEQWERAGATPERKEKLDRAFAALAHIEEQIQGLLSASLPSGKPAGELLPEGGAPLEESLEELIQKGANWEKNQDDPKAPALVRRTVDKLLDSLKEATNHLERLKLDLAGLLKKVLAQKGRAVDFQDHSQGLARVFAIEQDLAFVMETLLDLAGKRADPEETVIHLDVERDPPRAIVSIETPGQPRAWTGSIGLDRVRSCIEEHLGLFSATELPETGPLFWFSLPTRMRLL